MSHLWAMLGLCAVTLVAYFNSFDAGFTMDSRGLLLGDSRVHAATWENVQLILRHTYWWPYGESGLYRPLTTLTYLFNYAVLGNADQPAGYHAINLLLHACNVLFVYLLALRLLKTGWKAFAAAALWAVHPVLTESVTNMAGRPDLLAGLAVLSGLWMYLKSAESQGARRWAWLGGLAAVAALGVFSKESAVTLLGVIVLYELNWWRERRRGRALAFGCLALLPAFAAMAYQRVTLLSKLPPLEFPFCDNPLTAAGFWNAKLTALRILAKYLGLLIWPQHLSCDYSYAQIPMATGSVQDWAGWIAVAALVVVAVLAYRFERTVFFAMGFAFITFLPTSNILLWIGSIMAERFLYLPAIGFAICLVMAADALGSKAGYARSAPVALGVIGLIFAVRTLARNTDWRDNLTLMTAAVETSPNSYKTHEALATALYEADPTHANIDSVIAETTKSLAILEGLPREQSRSESYRQAAEYYLMKGHMTTAHTADGGAAMTAESQQAYQKALELLLRAKPIIEASYRGATARARAQGAPLPQIDAPKFADLEGLIATTHLLLGDPAQGAAAAADAITRAPQSVPAYRALASALLADGKLDAGAIALFEGILATSDMGLRSKLVELYQSGLPANSCALVAGPAGPAINPSCEIVRRHACAAAAKLAPIYEGLARQDLAGQVQRTVGTVFGCK
jgi:protein O-mannosyl-transferase